MGGIEMRMKEIG